MSIDAGELKQYLTLTHYELIINDLGGVIHSQNDTKWILYTMCHNLDALDGSPKLEFYVDTRHFMCYTQCSCSYDIYSLCMQRFKTMNEEKTFAQTLIYIANLVGFKYINNTSFKKRSEFKTEWKPILNKYKRYENTYSQMNLIDKNILNRFLNKFHELWIKDGITIETMQKFRIGFYQYQQQIVIPTFEIQGGLVGVRVRNLNPDLVEKGYKYLPLTTLDGTMYNFSSNLVLYGLNVNKELIKYHKKIILVEGEKSVLQAESILANNIVVAMFGKNLSSYNRNQIISLGVEEVCIAIDKDYDYLDTIEYETFVKNVQKISKRLKGFCKITYIEDIDLLKLHDSPFDRGRETWSKLWRNRKEI